MALPSRQRRAVAVLLFPFITAFVVAFIAPIGYAVYDSLLAVERSGHLGLGSARLEFAGLSNYVSAFEQQDFLESFGRVFLFGIVQVPVMITLAVVLALLLETIAQRWAALFRVAYFLPYGVPGVIASLLWGFLYVPGVSPVVSLVHGAGLEINFLGYHTILWSIANIVLWQLTGYNMLIIVAQLKSIPGDLIEAARVDGANSLRVAWHVRLPLIRPAIVLTAVFSIIATVQLFTEPQVLSSYSGYITTNYTPNLSAYNQAFTNNNTHLASAQAVILGTVAGVLSFSFLKLVNWLGGRR